LATKNLTPELIEELETIDAALNRAITLGDIKGYLASNHQFHLRLYEAADAGILLSIAHMLLLRVGPSLRVVCGRFGTFQLPDLHEEALAAMRRSDAQGVADAVQKDLIQGIDQIRQSILGPEI
ncbi:MAG: FCD domain-containing protein, partial [Paracoccaceae bacterium]|nr:FCD domain-containing protein [Paracoccaceae bacterium]